MSEDCLAERVNKTLERCLFTNEEVVDGAPDDAVIVDAITTNVGFHPGRLADEKENIRSMLLEMPDDFMARKGGGMSFLNLCMDRHGHQWGEHSDMAALVALGIGVGLASYCMPREMWSVFPGGMPYVSINAEKEELATP